MDARFSFKEVFYYLWVKRIAILVCIFAFGLIGLVYGYIKANSVVKQEDGELVELITHLSVDLDDSRWADRDASYEAALQRAYLRMNPLLSSKELYDVVYSDPDYDIEMLPINKELERERYDLELYNEMAYDYLQESVHMIINIQSGVMIVSVNAATEESAFDLRDMFLSAAYKLVYDAFSDETVTYSIISNQKQIERSIANETSNALVSSLKQGILLGFGGGALSLMVFIVLFLLCDFLSSTSAFERYQLPLFASIWSGKKVGCNREESQKMYFNLQNYYSNYGDEAKRVIMLPVGKIASVEFDKLRDETQNHIFDVQFLNPAVDSFEALKQLPQSDGVLLLIKECRSTHENALELFKQIGMLNVKIIGIIAVK